ncbi:MAG: B12-binding domain-containing radical SAM protein [Clostridia bacterium]|nr:B12-binding domain-containing radical SAM protein [Clostridia bacterium]
MADILLINPPIYDTTKLGKLDCDEHWSPPLGIAYIASVLSGNGFDVKALDLYYTPIESSKTIIQKELGRIVGISCFSEQRVSTYRMIEYIRSLSKDVLIVLGGPHSNYLYKQLLESYPVDVVILGEGEITFLEIARAYLKNESIDNIPGIAIKRDGKVVLTAGRKLIEDLDSLPFPAYEHFLNTEYASINWFRELEINGRKADNMKWTALVGSRGCAYNCSFCSTPTFWNRRWRKRSPKNIVDEIEFLNKEYGYEFIDFSDDIFTLDQAWAIDVCKEIIRRNVHISWNCCTRVDAVSQELLTWMKNAGCLFTAFGIESFSAKVLDAVNKKVTKEKILKACEVCNNVDMNIEFLLIVGSPGETDETIGETVELIETVKPFAVAPSILTIFPGTQIYRDAVRDGFIDDSYWLTEKPCPYDTREHDIGTLIKWYNRIRDLDEIEKAKRPEDL